MGVFELSPADVLDAAAGVEDTISGWLSGTLPRSRFLLQADPEGLKDSASPLNLTPRSMLRWRSAECLRVSENGGAHLVLTLGLEGPPFMRFSGRTGLLPAACEAPARYAMVMGNRRCCRGVDESERRLSAGRDEDALEAGAARAPRQHAAQFPSAGPTDQEMMMNARGKE